MIMSETNNYSSCQIQATHVAKSYREAHFVSCKKQSPTSKMIICVWQTQVTPEGLNSRVGDDKERFAEISPPDTQIPLELSPPHISPLECFAPGMFRLQ